MAVRDIAVFIAVSFGLAALLDVWFLQATSGADTITASLMTTIWGLARMFTPTLGAILAIWTCGENVANELKGYLGYTSRALKYYLLAPLLIHLALAIYLAMGLATGLVDLDKPARLIAERTGIPKDLARLAIFIQAPFAYLAAISINALAALGEELGWRGYLFKRLGAVVNAKNATVIGTIWSLWHLTAIGLVGYNYPALRWAGVLLFTPLSILLTALMLMLVSRANSVLPAASLHGAFNALWGLTVLTMPLEGAAGEALGGLGALGIAAMAVTLSAFFLRRW